jgi:hypothetical protein
MRKLKLQVEELVVDSFEATGSRRRVEGTIRGHDQLPYSHEYNISCQMNCSIETCAPDTIFADTCDGPTCNKPGCVTPI